MTKHLTMKRSIWAVIILIALWAGANAAMVVTARLGIGDLANQAAFNAANTAKNSPINEVTASRARDTAETYAEQNGAHLVGDFHLNADGSVTLKVEKNSMNIGLDKLSFTKQWTHVEATATSDGQQG